MDVRELDPVAATARSALDVLATTDVGSCDRGALDVVLAEWRAVRSFTDVFEVRIARRARELAGEGRSERPEGILRDGGRRSTRDAKAAADREAVCDEMPIFEAALSDGDVSTGHLDAVATATKGLDDDQRTAFGDAAPDLAANAAEESVEDFARRCRELARRVQADQGVAEFEAQRKSCRMRRRLDRDTGMYHFHLEVDPVTGSTVSTAYLAHLASVRARHRDDDMTHERLAAMAMVELITGARAVDRRVPDITVLIDLDTYLHGLNEHSICETEEGVPIPPSTVRRLCCDADIGRAILNAKGELLDLGRSQRTANRAQRRALKAMYRTCGHPDCQVLFGDCQIHHVIWWERFGLTDLDNLIPLCSRHHHMVHEGGWTLTLNPDRTITLHRPDGTLSFQGSTVDRASTGVSAARRRTRRRRTAA
ncbi:MAG: HNH endonuclease [Acidimicrobiia bacterium]|nr:HNH endonuclease [Acidimicrobiia bacterium]